MSKIVLLIYILLSKHLSSFPINNNIGFRYFNKYTKSFLSANNENIKINKKLPVTILTGLVGVGKTTLLTNILTSNKLNKKYAIIINDMSDLTINSESIKILNNNNDDPSINKKIIEMNNGCICCTLRDDLLKEITNLAKENKYDHLIIESTGVSEPLHIAETFFYEIDEFEENQEIKNILSNVELLNFENENDNELKQDNIIKSLIDIADIDNMVTIVDGFTFLQDMKDAIELSEKGYYNNNIIRNYFIFKYFLPEMLLLKY